MTRSSARPRTVIRSFAVSCLTLLCLGLVIPAAGAATGDVTEFAIPTPASLPQGIVIGPDGVSWFAQRSANAIGSLSNGIFSQYPLPNAGSAPFWVALGSDGNSDTAPSSTEGIGFPIHVLALNAMGIHLLDYLQFEDLARQCEAVQRWEFLFAAAPLRLVRGTGSPLNPTAIF